MVVLPNPGEDRHEKPPLIQSGGRHRFGLSGQAGPRLAFMSGSAPKTGRGGLGTWRSRSREAALPLAMPDPPALPALISTF